MRRFLVASLGALSLVAASCGSDVAPALEAGETDTATHVTDRTSVTFDGDEVSFTTTHAGRPLVVNFWASWCPPCVEEMPSLEAIHQDLGGGVTFIGVNLQDERAAAERVAELTGVTYELVEDPTGELFTDFGAFTMPMTYFVSAEGIIEASHGGFGTEQQFRDLIDEHLLR